MTQLTSTYGHIYQATKMADSESLKTLLNFMWCYML